MSDRAAWFERKPRSSEAAQPKGTRELLPVKSGANDRWKRQHVKVAKKGSKRKRAASATDESARGGRRVKAEAKGTEEKGAGAASIAPSTADAPIDVAAKKQRIAKLATLLLEAPHKHIGLLEKLHEFATRDGCATIRKLALLSEVAALRDLIPAYRIRPPTDKELAMKVSAEVEALRAYEKSLIRSYGATVALLRRWLTHQTEAERLVGVRGLGALLDKGRDFNLIDEIIDGLVPVSNWASEAPRTAACAALSELFSSDTQGDATLQAVRRMATVLQKKDKHPPPLLEKLNPPSLEKKTPPLT